MTLESHVFAAALGALVPCFLLILQFEKLWARELPPQCSGVLDSVLWLSADAIAPHLECLGVAGRALYVDFYSFDLLLFPLVYATALLGVLRRLWPERRLLWTLPVLAATCDVAENVSMLKLLRLFPTRWETLEDVVSVLTRTKWVAVLSANIFVLLVALKWVTHRVSTSDHKDKKHDLSSESSGLVVVTGSTTEAKLPASLQLPPTLGSVNMKKLVLGSMAPAATNDTLRAKLDATSSCGLEIPLQVAYDSLCHDREIVRAVWRIPIPILYFCAFVSMLFAHIPASNMYEQGFAVSSALATSGSDTVTPDSTIKFANIGDISDVFEWLTDSFVPSVFVTQDYNGRPLTQDRWGRVAKFNKVLGAVTFQVTRKTQHSCDTQPFLANLYPYCYDSTNTTTEQRMISFDTNATEAAGKIKALKTQGTWLDFSAEELLITIVTYNGELQGYAVTEMQLSFDMGGSVQTSSSTTPALSNPYQAPITVAADIVVLVFFLLAVAMQVSRLYRHCRTGIRNLVCGDIWVFIEFASTVAVVVFYVVWFSIVMLMCNKEFRDNLANLVLSGKNWSDDEVRARLMAVVNMLKDVAKLTVALRLIATLTVFLLSLRILNRFRFHPRLSILTRTVASALHQFGAFFVVFIAIFVTFAVSGTILFGDRVEEFSSLQTAMETCINMLFGNFDYDSIQGLYAPVCMLYYWSYMIVVSLVLLNMMLAIVLDAYAEVSSESYQTHNNLAMSRIAENVAWSLMLSWLNYLMPCRNRPSTKDGPRVAHATGFSAFNVENLGRSDVVFRGRVRPCLLERVLSAMLEQQEANLESKLLTPRILVDIFPSANIHESEARVTLQHIVDGFVSPCSTKANDLNSEQQKSTDGYDSDVNELDRLSDDDESEAIVHPAAAKSLVRKERPSKTETTAPTNVTESIELQRMAAQLYALERKLDLLLEQKS